MMNKGRLMGRGLMALSTLLVLGLLLVLTGCQSAGGVVGGGAGSQAAVIGAAGVDVPSLLFRQHEFVKPVDNTAEGLFAALAQNKGAIAAAEFDRQLMEAFMRISAQAQSPITIHEVQP